MRPIRFVALSEDGQALVLADEVGRLLALPLDERIHSAVTGERGHGSAPSVAANETGQPSLAPRDIQARIRAGDSAEDVARVAGVPVDRVLRYAGPVLQERAMLAQHARRTKLRSSEKGQSLADVVDGRLAQHGVDADKISWDAYRRDDGSWRIVATWPSGKATAQAVWELDKARQNVTPHDDMAQYLCAERPIPILGQEPPERERYGRGLGGPSREPLRGGHEPMRPAADTARRESRPGRVGPDPIRAGRDALMASLDRPLGATPSGRGLEAPGRAESPGRGLEPPHRADAPGRGLEAPGRGLDVPGRTLDPLHGMDPQHPAVASKLAPTSGAPLSEPPRPRPAGAVPSVFDDDPDAAMEVPAVPSLAVLRPRRTPAAAAPEPAAAPDKPRKRLPSWDDVLFGSGPAARESS